MAMRGWSRRSRRGTLAVSDAAFASMQLLASALRRAEAAHGEQQDATEQRRTRELPACSAYHKVA
jgi:hypothetical protein